MQFIPGSHKEKKIFKHGQRNNENYTLQQELEPNQIDQTKAMDIVLNAGQISLHDVYLAHGSGVNNSQTPRRGMTLRLMPTNSLYDYQLANSLYKERGDYDGSKRKLYLMRGIDQQGKNNCNNLPN